MSKFSESVFVPETINLNGYNRDLLLKSFYILVQQGHRNPEVRDRLTQRLGQLIAEMDELLPQTESIKVLLTHPSYASVELKDRLGRTLKVPTGTTFDLPLAWKGALQQAISDSDRWITPLQVEYL